MTTMQQLTFIKPQQLEWQEVAAPVIGSPGEAIVRPLAVTRCDLDLYMATGSYPIQGPFAFGHEIAGEVVETGDGVTRFAPGDRVIVPFQINCGTCDNCRRGWTNACTTVAPFSAYGFAPTGERLWGGGLSDLINVPFAEAMLVKIPDTVSLPGAAAISDNAADGYRTVADPLAQRPGADILILGGLAQSVGLFAIQAARALGAGRIIYRDFDAGRLAKAKALGAEAIHTQYGPDLRAEEEFPIVVEAAGLPDALTFAMRSTQPCGICSGVSAGTSTRANIPLRSMYMKGITYTLGRVHARAEIDHLLDCAQCGTLMPDKVITRSVPFSQAADAMMESDIKIVFERD